MGRANLRILMIYDVVPQTRDLPAIPVNSLQMSQGRAFGFPASDLVGEVLGSSPAPVSGLKVVPSLLRVLPQIGGLSFPI